MYNLLKITCRRPQYNMYLGVIRIAHIIYENHVMPILCQSQQITSQSYLDDNSIFSEKTLTRKPVCTTIMVLLKLEMIKYKNTLAKLCKIGYLTKFHLVQRYGVWLGTSIMTVTGLWSHYYEDILLTHDVSMTEETNISEQ